MDERRSPMELGEAFLAGVTERDWVMVAGTFAPDSIFQAVVDNEAKPFRDKAGGQDAASQIARWFDDADVHEVVAGGVEPLSDRVHIWYRVHNHEPDGWHVVEQHAFGDPAADADGFRRLVLVCSGFRPAAPRPGDSPG